MNTTKSGTQYKRGDIVVVPFPFSDLSAIKQRPVLVLSNEKYNMMTEDVITCGITSNIKEIGYTVLVDNSRLASGFIPVQSRIKPDKIFTLKKSLIRK